MDRCDAFQAQLLEYLYDLLDDGERLEVQHHLDSCPACRATLERVEGQKQLLATAARMEFPGIRFEAPSGDIPVTLPLPPARPAPASPRRGRWRWIAAAAVLLVLGGTALPGYLLTRDYLQARQTADEGQRILTHEKDRVDEAARQLALLPAKERRRIAAIEADDRDKGLKVILTGADRHYRIQTRNLNDRPTAATVWASVTDEHGQPGKRLPVQRVPDEGKDGVGVYRLTLPLGAGNKPELIVFAQRESGARVEMREALKQSRPVAETYLTLDKPLYQPGEVVRFRSLTLDRATLRPLTEKLRLTYVVTPPIGQPYVLDGSDVLQREDFLFKSHVDYLGPDGKPVRGIGTGSLRLSDNAPGGEYTLTVRPSLDGEEAKHLFPEQSRSFTVQRYQKPRFIKEVELSRSTFGPGDELTVRCKASRLTGEPLAQRPIEAALRIDGKLLDTAGQEARAPLNAIADAKGEAVLRFKLPPRIDRGEATLNVVFRDGADVESVLRTLPVVGGALRLDFYPEGGACLVAGLPNRVYFQARSALGLPAHVTAQLLEDDKPIGTTVRTSDDEASLCQGLGRFEFTPRLGHRYALAVESSDANTYPLPSVVAEGVLLSVPESVVKADRPIRVQVRATRSRPLLVAVTCRGQLLDTMRLEAGQQTVALRPTSGIGGVCRVTVYDPSLGREDEPLPLAERLIYRHPTEKLNLTVQTDRAVYAAGQKAKLTLKATDEAGRPAAAVALVNVLDRSVTGLVGDRTPSLPAHFLLSSEVRRPQDLENADFLIGDHPRAAEALDLLLATHGWRTFVPSIRLGVNPIGWLRFLVDRYLWSMPRSDEDDRLLVRVGRSALRPSEEALDAIDQIKKEHQDRLARLGSQYAEGRRALETMAADDHYRAAVVTLGRYQEWLDRVRTIGIPLLALALAGIAIVLLVWSIRRGWRRGWPALAAMVGCAAMVVVALVWRPTVDMPALPDVREQVAQWAPPAEHGRGEGLDDLRDRKPTEQPAAPVPAPAMPKDGARLDVPGGGAGFGMGQGREVLREMDDASPIEQKPLAATMLGASGGSVARGGRSEKNGFDRAAIQESAAEGKSRGASQGRGLERSRDPDGIVWMSNAAELTRGLRDPMKRDEGSEGRKQESRSLTPMVVRAYANQRSRGPGPRVGAPDALCWLPVLVVVDGQTSFSFDLPDTPATYRITAFAHTLDGRLGSVEETLASNRDFSLSPLLPPEVSAGDTVDITVSIANHTAQTRRVEMTLNRHDNLTLTDPVNTAALDVPANGTARRLYRFRPAIKDGLAALDVSARVEGRTVESVQQTLRIVPETATISGSAADILETSATHAIVLPSEWIKGSLKVQLQAYPSTAVNLARKDEKEMKTPMAPPEKGFDSSRNHPTPKSQSVGSGNHSYHLFGFGKGTSPNDETARVPAHTPAVSVDVVDRARTYVQARRLGEGKKVKTVGAEPQMGSTETAAANDAYFLWALTEGAGEDVGNELEVLTTRARTSEDPYFLVLVANSLINRGRTATAVDLLKRVADAQKPDGHLDVGRTREAQIEVTSLAVLGWLRANPGKFHDPATRAIRWLDRQRDARGTFGSAPASQLALKAIDTYSRGNRRTNGPGELKLYVDDRAVAKAAVPANGADTLNLPLPEAEKLLKPGNNRLRVEVTEGNVFPYSLAWSYQTLKPTGDGPVRLNTRLDRNEAREGDAVRLLVTVENVRGKGPGTTIAVVGLPAGLALPTDLKQLRHYLQTEDDQQPRLGAFEVRGRDLVLAWRDLPVGKKIELPIDLICRVPGSYRGSAGQAYLTADPERKHWSEPLRMTIRPRE
jgi:hypothetical protein